MTIHWSRCSSTSLACLAMLVAVAGCSSGKPATKASEEVQTTQVKTVAVTHSQVQQTTLQPATVHAYFRAEVRAKASGFVRELKVDVGDYVQAGAELAVIDVPEVRKQRQIIESRIRRLEAGERQSQAGVDLATASVRSAEAKLAEAKSEMHRAEASLAASEAEFSRTQDLVQRQSLASRMLDEVRLKRDSEMAHTDAVSSSISSAEADVAVAEARKASAESDFEVARAETDIARLQLEELDVMLAYASLKAPFAGVVTDRNIEPGDLVRELSEVGQGEPLFVISQVDKVRVRIPVPEADAPLVRQGDEVTLTFPSFAVEAPIVGNVTRVSGSLDSSTRTMMVEVEMPNTDGKLLPGMFGQASISLSTETATNMLPARSIRFKESGEAFVYIVGEDRTVTVTPVTTGIDNGHSIEVKTGVEAGQQVIDAHLKRFTTGQKVAIVEN